jgi:DNA processing protein
MRAEQMVVELLGPTPVGVDDLIRRCQLTASSVMSILFDLELAGRVETLPGHRVALVAGQGG